MTQFEYDKAFSRSIGWVTESEQHRLSEARVAIAGSGGVGGIHSLTMARLGIGKFHLADFDQFGVENFNRQVGAFMSTVDKDKVAVMDAMVKDINPDAVVNSFANGVNEQNIDAFLDGVDVYIDSLDFFAMDARRLVFQKCYEKNIPALTAAPLGFGTSFLAFLPGQMSFEEYFGMQGVSENEQYLRFYLGLSPTSSHSAYLVDPSRLNLKQKVGPSSILGCTMAAGVLGTNVLKVILKRGEVEAAPVSVQWDPFVNQMIRHEMTGGAQNPEFLQRLAQTKPLFGID